MSETLEKPDVIILTGATPGKTEARLPGVDRLLAQVATAKRTVQRRLMQNPGNVGMMSETKRKRITGRLLTAARLADKEPSAAYKERLQRRVASGTVQTAQAEQRARTQNLIPVDIQPKKRHKKRRK